MDIRQTKHCDYGGLVITSLHEDALTQLERQQLLELLVKYGYLVLRGFRSSIAEFSALVKQSSSRISLDPARQFDGDVAQKVDAGYDAVGLHCENGNSPFWPDLCWFYCQQAPAKGSQTTLCDGHLVYQHLTASQKALFSEQDIVYSRHVQQQQWQTYAWRVLYSQGTAPAHVEQVTFNHLLSLIEDNWQTRISLNDDGSIYYVFQTPAIRASRINGYLTHNFANSLFGPSTYYEKPHITFADGTAIAENLLHDVEQICESLTCDVGWQQGDVVLIDNTRVMHGRRRIEDRKRTIFNALSHH